jgi:hypothetical protein
MTDAKEQAHVDSLVGLVELDGGFSPGSEPGVEAEPDLLVAGHLLREE